MDTKTKRLLAIKRILSSEKIGTQEELLEKLQLEGFELTQATVSRDLKLLQIGKRADPDRGSVFFLPGQIGKEDNPRGEISTNLLTAAIRSIQFANGFGIVKTLPGYSSSTAIVIDKANRYEIAGTIAGDDTILVIPDNEISQTELKAAILVIFPSLSEHIFSARR
jgi:transcriptional regulator of arginine metabolism